MSRKGKAPITLPKNVEVNVKNHVVTVKGPKATLIQQITPGVDVAIHDGVVEVSLSKALEGKDHLHGLYRSLIANMVIGVSAGFKKALEMVGVGYRASVKGRDLDVQVGFSHPTLVSIPEGIEVTVEGGNKIDIKGADFQKVGQFAARVRALRPPEPYQGKGIRYANEYIRRKAGKSAAKK